MRLCKVMLSTSGYILQASFIELFSNKVGYLFIRFNSIKIQRSAGMFPTSFAFVGKETCVHCLPLCTYNISDFM